ncbi:MAG: hypothetical protein WC473_01820 [Patescibacteria group bacterium]
MTKQPSLFDENGVRIPYNDLNNQANTPNWDFRFVVPQFFGKSRFAQALSQFKRHLPAGSELPQLNDFYFRFMAIIETVSGREDVCNILNGPCLPLVFAAGAIKIDLGTYLENTVLAGVRSAYEGQFAGRPFNIARQVKHQVNYVPEINFRLFLEAMDAGPVVAAYFPDALRSWSILDARRQMETLPQGLRFVLPDVIIHGHAIIGYPDVMARDHRVPGNDCASNTLQSPAYSLYFEARDDCLVLGRIDDLAYTFCDFSSGLLLIG